MTKQIALLGLSGVGKTTLIARVGERLPVLHLQASALIKAEQAYRANNPDSSEALRTGAVIDNQELLIAAFLRETAGTTLPVIFDGHSVIDGRDGLVEIPASVFAALNLDAICYLSAGVDVIAYRRQADQDRPRPVRDLETLAAHQRIAREAARRIAEEIGCKFTELTGDDPEKLLELIGCDRAGAGNPNIPKHRP
jgi:adenylate kinase